MVFENKLMRKLQAGCLVFGSTAQLPSTALVEILGLAGFDFVMIDTEHGLFDLQMAGELIRAADGVGLTPLVRVTKNDESLILKALDMGAKGVIVPHISNSLQAKKAVRACKYGFRGRSACPLVRANQYGLGHWAKYQEDADKNIMVIVLVEDLEAVQNIEQIISVEGIDAVFLGAFDMSVSAGHKGNSQHPQIQQALEKVVAACKRRSITVMHTATNDPNLQAWVDKGVRMFLQGADSGIFARACTSFMQSVKHLKEKETHNFKED